MSTWKTIQLEVVVEWDRGDIGTGYKYFVHVYPLHTDISEFTKFRIEVTVTWLQ